MFLYVLVEDIKDNLIPFNNTHDFEQYIPKIVIVYFVFSYSDVLIPLMSVNIAEAMQKNMPKQLFRRYSVLYTFLPWYVLFKEVILSDFISLVLSFH